MLAPRGRRGSPPSRRPLPDPATASRRSAAARRCFVAQAYAALREARRARARPTRSPPRRPRPDVSTTWCWRSRGAARRPRWHGCSSGRAEGARIGRDLRRRRHAGRRRRRRPRSSSASPTSARSSRRGSRPARSRCCGPASARTSSRSPQDGERALAADLPIDVGAFDHFVFLGRGWTVGLANEAALKMREASGAWAESYPAMEYRHGPISVAGTAIGRLAARRRRARPAATTSRATGATVVDHGLGAIDPDGRAHPDPTDGGRARRGARAGPGPSAAPDPFGGALVNVDRRGSHEAQLAE